MVRSHEPAVFVSGMKRDRSVGIILFHDKPREYLILFKKNGTDFPKGHPEEGETDEQAAMRETTEETGITRVELISGYREDISFILNKQGKKTFKTVTYFLGKTDETAIALSEEHRSFKWCTPQEAARTIVFAEQRNLLKKAEAILAKRNAR